jgi:hypothetical protein
MYWVEPNLYLRMIEQDRERSMHQRALERAARAGREGAPGHARGGITLFVDTLRRAGSAIGRVHHGGSPTTSSPHGAPGI